MSSQRDQARLRQRAARSRHTAREAQLRDQRRGHLHRRRAGRHGAHPQGVRAGTAGDGVDRQASAHRGATRRRDRRRGPRRHRRGPRRHRAQVALPIDRAGIRSRRGDLPLPAAEDRDDCAGRSPGGRTCQVRRSKQGDAARLLAGHRPSRGARDRIRRAHGKCRRGRRDLPRHDDQGDVSLRRLAARDRATRHAAQARGAGRGTPEGRLPIDRSRAVPRPAGPGGGRRRQRDRGGTRLRRRPRHARDARLPRRRVRPGQDEEPRADRRRARGAPDRRAAQHHGQAHSAGERRAHRGRCRARGRKRRRGRPGRRRASDRASASTRRHRRDEIRDEPDPSCLRFQCRFEFNRRTPPTRP